MSFIKAIKDIFTMVDPVKERNKELMRPIPIPSPFHMSQLPSQYHQQISDLQRRNQNLQNQLAATQANQSMMGSMLQNQQQLAHAQQGMQVGGSAGGSGVVHVGASIGMMWDDEVKNPQQKKAEETQEEKDRKNLEKLLKAKI